VNVDANRFFVLGATGADLLIVDTSLSRATGPGRRNVSGLRIQNATNSKTITIDRMIVTWNTNARLNAINIDGSQLWSGNVDSPADADLSPDFTLNATPRPRRYAINSIQFNQDISGAAISVRFMMTDGSFKDVTVFPDSEHANFTVKSTGKMNGSNIYRTVEEEYNSLTGNIVRHKEINLEMTP